jgi:hypothetical protein
MDLLSTESMEKLRLVCLDRPDLINVDLDTLVDDFNLTFVPIKTGNEALIDLHLPEGNTQETNKDLENCKLIYDSLSMLSGANATDERLWTTLCFGRYSDYARLRWPLERAKTPKNHAQDHWFARTNRNRLRDNAISRLWWMAHIATRVPDASMDDVLRTLFFNSDYRSSLLERNTSANSINVVVSILSISQKAFGQGFDFHREKFRTFMKQVDFLGKRTSLPSLGQLELEELLSPLYAEAYGINKKKAGFLSIFSR